jgi:CubicO group peptidase (beta-lactamase class C family)
MLTLLLAALPLLPNPTPAVQDPFPPSTALAEGLDPQALESLAELVGGFVESGEVVGAELLVIVHGRTVLHRAYGWRDRERELPLEPGAVYCVRSMTKPLIGAATWMLIEEGRVRRSDPVGQYLPEFAEGPLATATVEHLLRHQSGLPFSLIAGRDARGLTSVREVSALAPTATLAFAPGEGFTYSDQGTDSLTALLEGVTGAPAEDFLRSRLLEPLGMGDSACLLPADQALRARLCSAYAGSPGSWVRYAAFDEAPVFPVFLGSQSLYSTAVDYARFLQLYLDRGRAGEQRLLRPASVRRTLEPGPWPMPSGTGFPGLRCDYGTLMQLWTRAAEGAADGERELVVFGHTGSDGTHAWAFPERDALVLYLTQSRGTTTGARVEEHLGELLLGVPFDPLQAAPPLEQFLGYYWEGEGDLYRAIVRDGEQLALEVVGRAVVPLDYIGEDRWKLRPEPATVIAFDRDGTGAVTGFHIGEHQELRLLPDEPELGAEELAEGVRTAHNLEALASAGVVRLAGRVELPQLERNGVSTLWLQWPDRWRVDEDVAGQTASYAFDGTTLRLSTGGRPVEEVSGPTLETLRASDPFLRFGDWRREGAPLQWMQELEHDGGPVSLVRTGDCSRPAATLYVDQATGRLLRFDAMTYLEGLGRLGQKVRFDDFREVGGALLPWRTEVLLANPLIGTIQSVVETAELGVQVPEGFFALADLAAE